MAAVTVRAFNGISPKTPPRLLQDTQAQTAFNAQVHIGSLKPIKGLGTSVAVVNASAGTIYKFGQDSTDESAGWLYWSTDVDVARGQINGDTEEWTFYTGDGYPKAIRAGYTASPIPMGQAFPDTALTTTLGADPDDAATLIKETRVYTYTYVRNVGARSIESAPAPASEPVDVYPGQEVTLSSFVAPSSPYAADTVRIYRSVSGEFLFVAEITLATALADYTDAIDPENLGEIIPSLSWLPPPDNLAGLINLPNGIMAGFSGRDVYFCDPYIPHGWPDEYRQTLDYPIVGLGRMNTTLAVLTKGTPYFIQGSFPDSMVVVKSDIEQACSSKRSIVSFNGVVFYCSPDGLVMLSSNGSRIITENMFTYDQWQAQIDPESVQAYHHEGKYVAFYNNGTTAGNFVYDTITGQFSFNSGYYPVAYQSLRNDKLYVKNTTAVQPWQEGSDLSYTWKSKKFTMPQVLGMSCAQVEAEAYPVTLRVYADGVQILAQVVASRFPFRLPAVAARDWEFQVEGDKEVFSVSLAQSMGELANV